MGVVDAVVETCGALITPERSEDVRPEVREGAVSQLEEFVPLHRKVSARVSAEETHRVVHDVLQTERYRWKNMDNYRRKDTDRQKSENK